MAPEAVQPLRINKSPPKMPTSGVSRPLSEISPMGIRRNSPSFNQTTGKPLTAETGESSSPFEHSPVNSSPRLFWKSRDTNAPSRRDSENSPLRNGASSSPVRRTSLEKLKTASRVTNSQMFAREHDSDYDPDCSPVVDRPLASHRPLSQQVQGNAWMGTGLEGKRNDASSGGHRRTESNTNIPILLSSSPSKPTSPSKLQQSPQKSSLSSPGRYAAANVFDPEEGTWSDGEASTRANTPKALRQAKSVTFDNAPPQINEYEMITPDPSSVASGSREGSYDSEPFDMDDAFERADSPDREDSFDDSLEDADKTPVVLPEDWRFMSPEAANTSLADTFEDPFERPTGVSSPSTRYRPTPERDMAVTRSSSDNSNGDRRPLPPLPASKIGHRSISSKESISKSPLSISTPPRPASVSKAEILGMRSSPIPLEERLRLLSVEQIAQSKAEQAQKLNKTNAQTHSSPQVGEEECKSVQSPSQSGSKTPTGKNGYKPPPRVSRESILNSLKPQKFEDVGYGDPSPAANQSVDREEIDYLNLDPDVPIPSRETSSIYGENQLPLPIKQEDSDDEGVVDMYALPEGDDLSRSPSPIDDFGIDSSVIHYDLPHSDTPEIDEELAIQREINSNYSVTQNDATGRLSNADVATPKIGASDSKLDSARMSLPEFTSIFSKDDFDFGLQSYLTPTKEVESEPEKKILPVSETRALVEAQQRPSPALEWAKGTPDLQKRASTPVKTVAPDFQISHDFVERDASTPESVIHRPIEDREESPSKISPTVPEPVATIKAPGSKLKTRLSATPADLQTMSATRRQISGEQQEPIVEHQEAHMVDSDTAESQTAEPNNSLEESTFAAESSRPSLNVQLDVPLLDNGDLGFGLGEEFDRLLEGKKKGYLMRQNTNVIVASNRQLGDDYVVEAEPTAANSNTKTEEATQVEEPRGTRSAGNSPRKTSKTWTTEPWNGRMRRHSTRRSIIVSEKKMPAGPAPPMPGQESNVTETMETVSEDQIESAFDDCDDSGERGRVFVKVVGVKELDLPLPQNERCHFQMTLDNGLHCVTTSWTDLGRTAPIGQEFELVVFDDLEFQLTLQTKLERPQSAANSMQSFTPSLNAKKPSALSRMFTSPKKRRELEKKQRDDEAQAAMQREQEMESQRINREPTAWDLQNELVGPDGSFARAYVCLSNYERQAYGRPYTVDIPCWNEWAVEDKSIASTRSKNGGVQRKPPYRIGKMELQLLYVPKPRNAVDEDMPKSMAAAGRMLREAEAASTRKFEGHLSQQGGDCPYWRRRFFKLNGSKLTAYHDMTRQPRATISLAKATKLIDDKSALTQPDPTSAAKSKNRRKSAFAEEEEGYMFVEEGFRIRFANGEVIDFYADNSAEKNRWMRVLSEVVGKESPTEKTTWMSMVLARERAAAVAAAKSSAAAKGGSLKDSNPPFRNTSRSAPTSPQKPQIVAAGSTKSQRATNGVDTKENKSAPIEKASRNTSLPSAANNTKSPVKPSASPTKQKVLSPVKEHKSPSKRNSANVVPSTSPRKQNKEAIGKRQAVRSMIF